MSELTHIEKIWLERWLEMGGGYVLNFSNRTLDEFVIASTGKSIYDKKYDYESGSKANRIRKFWKVESNYHVGTLLLDLLEHYCVFYDQFEGTNPYKKWKQIAQRLKQASTVEDKDAIAAISEEVTFKSLAKSVRESIDKNEPEAGLDRLHTFVVKYVRTLCEKHGIGTNKAKPLHSMFGEYVKHLKKDGRLESVMSERILKSSISILEAFNEVRNNKSYAHDNSVLNYSESLLIFKNISSSIKFINEIEKPTREPDSIEIDLAQQDDNLPF